MISTTEYEVVYKARPKSHISDEDAQIIGPEIERLRDLGNSSAPSIVREAEVPASPLHSYFEWDDTEAGRRYREHQARILARSIVITVIDQKGEELESASAFVAVSAKTMRREYVADGKTPPPALNGYKQYVPVMVARKSPNMTGEVLAEARREFLGRARKYEGYRELFAAEDQPLADVMDAIDQLKEDEVEDE